MPVVTITLCIGCFGERPAEKRTLSALGFGLVILLLALVLFPLCARAKTPWGAPTVIQPWVAIGCAMAVAICVAHDTVRLFAWTSLVGAGMLLTAHHQQLILSPGYAGIPRPPQRYEAIRKRCVSDASEVLRKIGEADRAVYPAGWVADAPFVEAHPDSFDGSRCFDSRRYEVWPVWHTFFTSLYRKRGFEVSLWYPSGKLADAWNKIEYRERPDRGRNDKG